MSKLKLDSLIKEDKPQRRQADVKLKLKPTGGEDIRIYKGDNTNKNAHKVILAWMNNGQDQGAAWQSVHKGKSLAAARNNASRFFRRPEVVRAVDAYMHKPEEQLEPKPEDPGLNKTYAVDLLKGWIEINILDYFGETWDVLSPREMRESLPREVQIAISEIQVNESIRRNDEGDEIINRTVRLKPIEKLKSLETMAKIEKWITTQQIKLNLMVDADTLVAAATRRMERLVIEGEADRVEDEGR